MGGLGKLGGESSENRPEVAFVDQVQSNLARTYVGAVAEKGTATQKVSLLVNLCTPKLCGPLAPAKGPLRAVHHPDTGEPEQADTAPASQSTRSSQDPRCKPDTLLSQGVPSRV